MNKTAYKYDPKTFIYEGTEIVQESPLEPGVWLWPPNVTTDTPPVPDVDKTLVYINGQWRQVLTDSIPIQHSENPDDDREYMVASRFQAKAAMLNAGILTQVDAYFSNGLTTAVEKLAWADATNFYRLSPLVVSAGAALGLTDTQLDALFIAAMGITV